MKALQKLNYNMHKIICCKTSKGLTFENSFSNNREEQLFTTHNPVEYLMPYDPYKGPKAQIVKMGAEQHIAKPGE